ncbi:hypothetical protein [Nocardia sp. NPDC052112]|uniref:hypothetical protein n=1 Tax=Nocardia sp. NPDC052112 TaxID=3155646 RepID=UPI003424A5FD
MISSGADLLAWIETNLPEVDQDRFGPWRAEPATPTAHTAHISVRIHSPGTADRITTVTLSAAPIGMPAAPRDFAAPQPDSR